MTPLKEHAAPAAEVAVRFLDGGWPVDAPKDGCVASVAASDDAVAFQLNETRPGKWTVSQVRWVNLRGRVVAPKKKAELFREFAKAFARFGKVEGLLQ